MPDQTASPLVFRKRLGALSKLYYGFLASTAVLVFFPTLYILLHQWSDLEGQPLRWILLATTIAAPPVAWVLWKAVFSGLDLWALPRPQGPYGQRLWQAMSGSPQALADLQLTRERIRAALLEPSSLDEATCANYRAVYTYTLEAVEQLIADLTPSNVVPVNGVIANKELALARLETERSLWQADYQWFETCMERIGR